MEALDVEIEIGMISQAAGDAKKATLLGMKMLAGTPLPPHCRPQLTLWALWCSAEAMGPAAAAAPVAPPPPADDELYDDIQPAPEPVPPHESLEAMLGPTLAHSPGVTRETRTAFNKPDGSRKPYVLLYFSAHWCPPCRCPPPRRCWTSPLMYHLEKKKRSSCCVLTLAGCLDMQGVHSQSCALVRGRRL